MIKPLMSTRMTYAQDDDHDPDWLLSLSKQADCVILDVDNCPAEVSSLTAYFIANSNTFWLTNGEQVYYNKISPNRIYNLDNILQKSGDKFEKLKTVQVMTP